METLYSIIVPAYNEEYWLASTLASIQSAMEQIPLTGEVIVCDNNSTDATATIAAQFDVSIVFEPYNQISRARNSGARQAKGRYLIFIDADTIISTELLTTALRNLESGRCCGGGAIVTLDHEMKPAERIGLWAWNQLSMRMRIAAGCFIYCLREDFEAVGGFSEAVYASEELWLSRQLSHLGKKQHRKFCIINEFAVHTSGRKSQWFGPTQQFMLLILLLLFPFLVRYRWFCDFWYKRPDDKPGQN